MNETNIEHATSNAEHRTWGDAALRMTNDEFLMTKEFLIPNDEGQSLRAGRNDLDIRASTFLRHSSFRFRHFPEPKIECGIGNQATDNGPRTTDHRRNL